MKKRTLRLRWLVAAIMLPLVMGACTTWQQPGPRNVITMTNQKVPYYPNRNSNYAKWGRGVLFLLGFSPTAR